MDRQQLTEDTFSIEDTLLGQRARIVRLCTQITGDIDAAEDLAQETLVEAWRHVHMLRDQGAFQAWLSGIARNVCLRWFRRRRREQSFIVALDGNDHGLFPGLDQFAADSFDLEIELERKDLGTLLDRALGLLPVETRAVLIQKYVEEVPLAEIAGRLGLLESTVGVRLHRGKLAFRRVLTNELREEAMAYGLVAAEDVWQATHIWCPYCGVERLLGRFVKCEGSILFQLRCAAWCNGSGVHVSNSDGATFLHTLGAVKGYKPALSRVMHWVDTYYRRDGVVNPYVPCLFCGRQAEVRLALPSRGALMRSDTRGLHIWCPFCAAFPAPNECLTGFILCTREGRRFWREHERIRTLPEREVEADGQALLIRSFESVTGSARLDILVARDTFRLIGAHGVSLDKRGVNSWDEG